MQNHGFKVKMSKNEVWVNKSQIKAIEGGGKPLYSDFFHFD